VTEPTPPPAQPQKPLNFLRPAITGGLFLGVLSTVPIINFGCCLWILGGGGLATFLVNKQRPGGLKYGDGALAGVSSGLVGTIVSALINIPLQMVMYTPAAAAEMREQFTKWSIDFNLPPDFVKQMEPMLTPGFSLARLLMGAISFSVVGGLFAMIGGILAVALLNRRKPV
jgi:hypothetical protein